MKLLYKAYACEHLAGGKFILPGYPLEHDSKPLQSGQKIKVELADGTWLDTTIISTKELFLDASIVTKLNLRIEPDCCYVAIQVPDDFSPQAVNLGVKVYLDDPTAS